MMHVKGGNALSYNSVSKYGRMCEPRLALVRRPYRWALHDDYNKEISPRFLNVRAAYWWVQGYLSKQTDNVS